MKHKFTLLELLIVVAIIAILLSMLLPSINKTRKKAAIAVCLSNQKQISAAAMKFCVQNNGRFPFPPKTSGDGNRGRFWVGKKGHNAAFNIKVKKRPLNKYLGYEENGIEVPVAKCPLSHNKRYDNDGSNYMATQRIEHNDDLDTKWKASYLYKIHYPRRMVLLGEVGAWHYSYYPNNPWQHSSQWHSKGKPEYSFSFIDGHAINTVIKPGMGSRWDGRLNFRNFR